jgi:hypothetical protein
MRVYKRKKGILKHKKIMMWPMEACDAWVSAIKVESVLEKNRLGILLF